MNDIESLYQSTVNGDKSAADRLFSELFLRFRIIVRKRIWKEDDAEDVVQEALKDISANYRTAKLQSPFAAWAYKVLLHKVWNYYRDKKMQSKRFVPLDELDIQGEGWVPDPTLEHELKKCLQKLIRVNARYARILVLIYQGFSSGEICRKMEISKANCYAILSRARSMIKLCMQKGDIE